MSPSLRVRIAALFLFLAVTLGAMGAHALEARLAETGYEPQWETAALHHMIHGLAMLAVSLGKTRRHTPFCYWAWGAGIILFSGSLYVLSVTGIGKLGAITPLGGLAFLAGWAALVIRPGSFLTGDEKNQGPS